MKRVIKYLFLLMLFIPYFVLADTTYELGVKKANSYIYEYGDYARYIKVTGNMPYGFNGSKAISTGAAADFTTGGFLSRQEYEITNSGRNSSYLAPGIQYWLMKTDANVLQRLDTNIRSGNESDTSGVRVTEYVLHGTKVKGIGTITTPWEFVDGFIVKIGSSDNTLGKISPTAGYEHVDSESEVQFTLEYDTNYNIDFSDCENAATRSGAVFERNGNDLTVKHPHGDFTCVVSFGTGCNKVNFTNAGKGTGGLDGQSFYYRYGKGWFSNNTCSSTISDPITKPVRTGYTFISYAANSVTIIDNTPKIVVGSKESRITNNMTVPAVWTPNVYKITLDNADATTLGSSEIFERYDNGWYATSATASADAITTITKPERTNYNFLGYYDGTTQIIDKDGRIIAANNKYASDKTLNAQWELAVVTCPAGKYLPKEANACSDCTSGNFCAGGTWNISLTDDQGLTPCPSGYGNSPAGSSARNQCYINVSAGKYIKTANATTQTDCAKGYYKTAHTVNYGSISSCTHCPSGYRDGSGTTSESNCVRTVAAGNYLKTANDTTDTACSKGYYKASHNVKYGNISSCTQCPSGYRDGTAASSESNCVRTVAAGKYLKTANDTTDTACSNGYYKTSHNVKYGNISSCTQCPSGYRDGSGATAESNCVKSVSKGYYVKDAKGAAVKCSKGYYAATVRNVKYGSTNSCTACPSGKTTANTGSTAASACVAKKTCYRPSYAKTVITVGSTKYACGTTGDDKCQNYAGALYGCHYPYTSEDYRTTDSKYSSYNWFCYNVWSSCQTISGTHYACFVDHGETTTVASTQSCPAYYCTTQSSTPCGNFIVP